MNRARIVVLLVALFEFAGHSLAAGAPLSWKVYKPTNTGIQGNYAYSILFDPAGGLWVAADNPNYSEGGLARFDGTAWSNWSSIDGVSPVARLQSMKRDALGRIWAASSIGLVCFDGASFRVYDKSNAPLPSNEVRDVALDGAGNVWIAMNGLSVNEGGLARFDGTNWTVWTRTTGIPWPAPWNGVECVAVDGQNRVWIGSDVVGAAMFDGVNWTYFDPWGPNPPPHNWINDILCDPTGAVWFSTPYNGIGKLVGTTWSYSLPIGTDAVSTLTWGPEGRLYAGTYSAGVQSFGGGSWRLEPGWPGSHVYSIAFDGAGRLWASGIGGVARRNPGGAWTIYDAANTGLPSRQVEAVHEDGSGKLWIGMAGGGLSRFDGTVWTDFNPYNHGAHPWPFATDGILTIQTDAGGRAWAGTYGQGIVAWENGAWIQRQPIPGLSFVRALTHDRAGRMWAAVDGALARYDGVSWTSFTTANAPLPSGELHALAADAQGYVWVGTFGLLRTDGVSWFDHSASLPANAWVYALAMTDDGVLWVGTDQGLLRYAGSSWTRYTEANSGLPADVITALEVAPDGRLWVGAFDGRIYPYHGGVARFDGVTWETWTTANSGLPHNQVSSVHVASDGRIWIGTASEGVAVATEQGIVAVDETGASAAPDFGFSIRPNPFASLATLAFRLGERSHVRLDLFDIGGRHVRSLLDGVLEAGEQSLAMESSSLPAGLYHARLTVAGRSTTRRLVHLGRH